MQRSGRNNWSGAEHGVCSVVGQGLNQDTIEFLVSCVTDKDYSLHMTLSEMAKQELEFWENLSTGLSCPISLHKAVQMLYIDASDNGIGGYINRSIFSDRAPEGHINIMKLVA